MSATVVAAAMLAGCGSPRMDQVEKDLKRLRGEIGELRRGQAGQRVQFDGFRNRLVVLQDKLESEQLAATRRAAAMRRTSRQGSYGGHAEQGPSNLQRVVLPAAAPAPPPAPTKTVTIGPDGVPEVLEPAPVGKRSRTGAKKKRASTSVTASKARSHKGAVPAGPRGANRPPHDGQTDEERAAGAYRTAKSMLDAGRVKEARAGFASFLSEHPKHALADNAQYWTGETWYAQAMWLKAARAFGEVVGRYPNGNKVPDAMLKTGLCYRKVGENKLAAEVFEQLRNLYPGTASSRLAATQLKNMGVAP